MQTPIGKEHRRRTAEHDRGKPSPAETIDRQDPCATTSGSISEAGDAETERGNIPRRQTAAQPEPRHHDPAGPDADRGQTAGRTAQILREVARPGHGPLRFITVIIDL